MKPMEGSRLAGPDGFGYSASEVPIENLEIVGKTGTATVLASGDDSAAAIDLGGNTFSFYGASYTGNNQLFVSSNGLITFGSSSTSYSNSDLTSGPAQRAIAVLWDDLINGAASPSVVRRFEDTNGDGTIDRLVIEWNQVYAYGSTSGNGMTFQAILQLNTGGTAGAITLNYVDLATGDSYANGSGATVGIKDANTQGANRLLASYNSRTNSFVQSGHAIQFTVPTVTSIVRSAASPTNAGSVTFSVSFSDSVSGVDAGDFALAATGLTGAAITGVAGSGSVYTVTVNTGSGDGTLVLNLIDNDTIRTSVGAARLGGTGVGNGSFSVGQSYLIDKTPPDTTLSSTPAVLSGSASATFAFTGSDAVTAPGSLTFQSSLDGGAWTAATGPLTLAGLGDGHHTFAVRAVDQAGNIDASPAAFAWTVDTTAPDTSFTATPSDVTNSTSATFVFAGTDNIALPGSLTFEVKLDGGAWTAGISPTTYTGLGAGAHTLQVRAIDPAGNVDASPAASTWTVVTATVAFVKTDGTTQGSWQYAYGADGYVLSQGDSSLPGYATVSVAGASNYVWNQSTTDTRALRQPGMSNRLAACWYSSTNFTIDVNITDGQSHQVTLDALDWDGWNGPRQERIDVLDAGTGKVLDSQTVSNFGGGLDIVWNITGHVKFVVTNLLPNSNAVLSGLFFGPGAAQATSPIAIRISEDAYLGHALYTIAVDGVQVGGTLTATAAHGQALSETVILPGLYPVGPHTVAVTFLNDKWAGTPATDRNLYVDGIDFDGLPYAGATLFSNGTKTFRIG